MLKFGINSLGSQLLQYTQKNADKLLIGWRFNPSLLGFYDRAYNLFVMPINQLSSPISSVTVVTLSRLQNDPEKFTKYFFNAVTFIAFIGMPLSAILTLTGNDLILILLGEKWTEAGYIFTAFGPGIGVMLLYQTISWVHISIGRAERLFLWTIISFIATILCFVVGLLFGTLGVAAAYTLSFYILILPGIWYAGKPIQVKWTKFIEKTWKPFFSAVAAGLICWLTLHNTITNYNITNLTSPILRIIFSVIIFTPLYLFMIILTYRSTEEITTFYNVFSDIFFSKKKNNRQ